MFWHSLFIHSVFNGIIECKKAFPGKTVRVPVKGFRFLLHDSMTYALNQAVKDNCITRHHNCSLCETTKLWALVATAAAHLLQFWISYKGLQSYKQLQTSGLFLHYLSLTRSWSEYQNLAQNLLPLEFKLFLFKLNLRTLFLIINASISNQFILNQNKFHLLSTVALAWFRGGNFYKCIVRFLPSLMKTKKQPYITFPQLHTMHLAHNFASQFTLP